MGCRRPAQATDDRRTSAAGGGRRDRDWLTRAASRNASRYLRRGAHRGAHPQPPGTSRRQRPGRARFLLSVRGSRRASGERRAGSWLRIRLRDLAIGFHRAARAAAYLHRRRRLTAPLVGKAPASPPQLALSRPLQWPRWAIVAPPVARWPIVAPAPCPRWPTAALNCGRWAQDQQIPAAGAAPAFR